MNWRRDWRAAPATWLLMGAILAVYLVEVFLTGPLDGAIQPREIAQGQYWRLLTAMFLHEGALHLAVNLIALFQLGRLYEAMFSTRRFVFIYFVTGLIASITSWQRLAPWGASVGASGAIFGVLGAFVFSIRRSPRWRHERWARNLVAQCVFWIIANIAISLKIPQIDVAAHLGGLAAGLLLGALLPHRVPPPPPSQTLIDVNPHDNGAL